MRKWMLVGVGLIAGASCRTSGTPWDQQLRQKADHEEKLAEQLKEQDRKRFAGALRAMSDPWGFHTMSPEVMVFEAGKPYEFTQDTLIRSGRVIFRDGAQVFVRGGRSLIIDSGDIRVHGSALIDARGQSFVPKPGEELPLPPPKGRELIDDSVWASHAVCTPERNGLPGAPGKNGGDGGIVVLTSEARGNLEIKADAGAGGPGGPGGLGALLVKKSGASCAGCTKRCEDGVAGKDGQPGKKGGWLALKDVPHAPPAAPNEKEVLSASAAPVAAPPPPAPSAQPTQAPPPAAASPAPAPAPAAPTPAPVAPKS